MMITDQQLKGLIFDPAQRFKAAADHHEVGKAELAQHYRQHLLHAFVIVGNENGKLRVQAHGSLPKCGNNLAGTG